MSANKDAKAEVVARDQAKARNAPSGVVLVEYAGMNVLEVTDLRNQLRKAKVEYKVLKNTLVNRAAERAQHPGLEPYLKGTTAVAFGYEDPTAPAKVLTEYMKKAGKLQDQVRPRGPQARQGRRSGSPGEDPRQGSARGQAAGHDERPGIESRGRAERPGPRARMRSKGHTGAKGEIGVTRRNQQELKENGGILK